MNAHFVNSEQIEVDQDCATGRWMMLQTSTFRDGKAHLNAAKLTVQFKRDPVGCWKISHFQTQNILAGQLRIGIVKINYLYPKRQAKQ